MNLKRVFRVVTGAMAGLALDNLTGISGFFIAMIPPPFNLVVGPAIGAIINGVAKYLRDNSETYEFAPTPVSAPVKLASRVF